MKKMFNVNNIYYWDEKLFPCMQTVKWQLFPVYSNLFRAASRNMFTVANSCLEQRQRPYLLSPAAVWSSVRERIYCGQQLFGAASENIFTVASSCLEQHQRTYLRWPAAVWSSVKIRVYGGQQYRYPLIHYWYKIIYINRRYAVMIFIKCWFNLIIFLNIFVTLPNRCEYSYILHQGIWTVLYHQLIVCAWVLPTCSGAYELGLLGNGLRVHVVIIMAFLKRLSYFWKNQRHSWVKILSCSHCLNPNIPAIHSFPLITRLPYSLFPYPVFQACFWGQGLLAAAVYCHYDCTTFDLFVLYFNIDVYIWFISSFCFQSSFPKARNLREVPGCI